MVEMVKIGLESLRRDRFRTLLSTLGVVMGVASLVGVLAVGDGIEAYARQEVAGTTDLQAVLVTSSPVRRIDGVTVPNSDFPVFSAADRSDAASVLPPGTPLTLMVQGAGFVTGGRSDRPRAAEVGARLGPLLGRLSAGRDIDGAAAGDTIEVLVNERLAAELAETPTRAVGALVRIERVIGRVVGVRPSAGEGPFRVEVPFDLAAQAMTASESRRPASLVAVLPRVEDVRPAKAALERWRDGHGVQWARAVTVAANTGRLQQVERGILIFKLLMGTITGISLLVGGVGIMNVLLASVAERTREIGIRKAAGARRRDVLAQFLVESVTITGVGSAIGVAFGLLAAFAATAVMRSRTEAVVHAAVSGGTIAVAIGAGVATGLLFGIYPAVRAARLDPIEAIRHE